MKAEAILGEIAAGVADGETIDWERVGRRSGSARGSAERLRLISVAAARGRVVAARDSPSLLEGWAGAISTLLAVVACLQVALVVVSPAAWAGSSPPAPRALIVATVVWFAGAGALLMMAGRRDRRAVVLGHGFCFLGAAAAQPLLPTASPIGAVATSALLLGALLPEAFLPFALWRFAGVFPRVVRLTGEEPVLWTGRVAGAAVGTVFLLANALSRGAWMLGGAGRLDWIPANLLRNLDADYWSVLFLLCLPVPLVVAWRARWADEDERRRVRWMALGIGLGLTPLILAVLVDQLVPAASRAFSHPAVEVGMGVVIYASLLTIPLTLGYSVIAHRVLTVRFALSRALAFSLARATTALVAGIPSVGLTLHVVRHSSSPVVEVLGSGAGRGWLLATAASWLLFLLRERVLRRLQLWLEGPLGDSSEILARFSAEAGHGNTAAGLGRILVADILPLLGARSGSVLLRRGGRMEPLAGASSALAVDSILVTMAANSGALVAVGPEESDTIFDWLLADDRRWILDHDAALLVPVRSRDLEPIGMVVVGPDRRGRPFGDEAARTLSALAATLSLAISRQTATAALSGRQADEGTAAAECAGCCTVAPADGALCACGEPMRPAALPLMLAGKFELRERIGQGGMGVVYRALDYELNREVALKTLPAVRGEALVRLRREARSMAEFVHPHLALIFGMESWQGTPVLVVEYLPGGNLEDRLRSGVRLDQALEIVELLASALAAMHDRGVLHRDVKPQNVGFGAQGEPKLLDFGLAHIVARGSVGLDGIALSELGSTALGGGEGVDPAAAPGRGQAPLTGCGSIVGTAQYLDPESLAGAPPSVGRDLWALHLLLWEMVTSAHPFAELAGDDLLRRLQRASLPFERLREKGVPDAVQNLLRAGLAAEPASRPSSARGIIEEVRRIRATLAPAPSLYEV